MASKSTHTVLDSGRALGSDAVAGLGTALFGVPSGLAFAKLAGVDPIYGLYSCMVATIVSSLGTGTVLMVGTLTSAIAVSTKSILGSSGIETSLIPSALFTLSFMVGVIMLTLGLLRLGKIVKFISNAVLTGYVLGIACLIIIGEFGDLVGYPLHEGSKLHRLVEYFQHFSDWDVSTTLLGLASCVAVLIAQRNPVTKVLVPVIVLIAGAAIVSLGGLSSVALTGSIAQIHSQLPSFVHPDPSLMPKLALGAISITLIALTEGASISTAFPNPDGSEAKISKDFRGIGVANIIGSFFQSMSIGGSLSRSAMCVKSGAKSRLAGIFTGVWMMALVYFAGSWIVLVPLTSIAGVLWAIIIQVVIDKRADVKLMFATSPGSATVLTVTFLCSLFIPLQWTIMIGAGLSWLVYAYTSSKDAHLVQLKRNDEGFYEETKPPEYLESNSLTILQLEGNGFFSEVPVIKDLMVDTKSTRNSVLIWRMRGLEDVHSASLKWFRSFARTFRTKGNRLILEGVEPHILEEMRKTGVVDVVGEDNVLPAQPGLLETLEKAVDDANHWIEKRR